MRRADSQREPASELAFGSLRIKDLSRRQGARRPQAIRMRRTRRVVPAKFALALPAVLLSACQIMQTPAPPAPHLNINPSANQQQSTPPATDPNANGANTTYTVKRDTLTQTLQLQGKVAPSRSAQLTLPGGGTVTDVSAEVGQEVKQGDKLAEFSADDQTLQAARTQATLAELAYEQEQTKLDQLQSGTPKETIDQAVAVVARDKSAIAQLNQQTSAAAAAADKSQQAATITKAAADRKVQMAQVAVQTAQDNLAMAQDAANEATDATKAAQTQAQVDANAAVASAKQNVVQAQRALQVANIKLSQAKMDWANTRARQTMESLQFKIAQDQDAVKQAKQASDAAQHATPAEAAAADAALAAAQRALQADQLEQKHDQTDLDTSHTVDDAAIQQAQLDQANAQDALTAAQAAQQKAEEKAQALAQQPAALAAGQSRQLTPAAAQAAVVQAQRAVDTANLNLQDAQATADQAGDGAAAAANVPPAPDQSSMDAAKAQLDADQAHLNALQSPTSQSDVAREQARVNLLHDQATAAAAAAQPVITLKAPFDGTVTDVGITPGQTVAPGGSTATGASAAGGLATVGATLAGQTNQGVPVAIRLVAAGATTIVADASESDVAQLSQGQTVDVSFPGLSGPPISAAISQIASTPTNTNGRVSYPVQINVDSPPQNLKMGMTAQVSLIDSDAAQLIAPRTAVQTVGGQPTVTKVDSDGQTQNVQVQLGKSSGGNVELLDGVQEGDKLLLAPPAAPALPLMAAQQQAASHP